MVTNFVWPALWVLAGPLACVVLYWRQSRKREEGEQCSVCGYPARGLPTSICPECGSDLLKVGYRRPGFWSGLLPGKRRRIVTIGWCVWAALGLLLWTPYQQYLAPGEVRMYEGYAEHIPRTKLTLTVWRTEKFGSSGISGKGLYEQRPTTRWVQVR